MSFSYSYTGSSNSELDDWVFVGPGGTGLLTSDTGYRYWCYDTNDTPSGNVGPTSGQGGTGDGYVYTEASTGTAPTQTEYFTMTFDNTLDANSNSIIITFYTNQRGDFNNSVCELQTSTNGTTWNTRATYGGSSDPNKVATGGTDVWVQRTVDLTNTDTNSNTRVRFRIASPVSGGNHWHNDYGLDTISLIGTNRVSESTQTHQMII